MALKGNRCFATSWQTQATKGGEPVKNRVFAAALVLVLLAALACESVLAQVRGFEWGTPKSEVMSKERANFLIDLGSFVVFTDRVLGMPVMLAYWFDEKGELAGLGYGFLVEHINSDLYIRDYERVKRELILKYGDPAIDDATWFNDYYKDDRAYWGFALSLGYVKFETTWLLFGQNTMIYLTLETDEETREPKMALAYRSISSIEGLRDFLNLESSGEEKQEDSLNKI